MPLWGFVCFQLLVESRMLQELNRRLNRFHIFFPSMFLKLWHFGPFFTLFLKLLSRRTIALNDPLITLLSKGVFSVCLLDQIWGVSVVGSHDVILIFSIIALFGSLIWDYLLSLINKVFKCVHLFQMVQTWHRSCFDQELCGVFTSMMRELI